MISYYKRLLTQTTEREIRRRETQAKQERYVRDMKDLAGVAYMGKGDE